MKIFKQTCLFNLFIVNIFIMNFDILKNHDKI